MPEEQDERFKRSRRLRLPEGLATRWWVVLLAGTFAVALLIGFWSGSRLGPGPEARPGPPADRQPTQAQVTAYLTDPANRDRVADILSSPQMREPWIGIMSTARMQADFAAMLAEPRMQDNVTDIMAHTNTVNAAHRMFTRPRFQSAAGNILMQPESRQGVLDMLAQRQMQDLIRDMARDPRLRPVILAEIGQPAVQVPRVPAQPQRQPPAQPQPQAGQPNAGTVQD